MKLLIKYRSYLFIFFVWSIFSYPYFLKGLIPFPSTYLVSFFPPWSAYYGMPIKNNAMPDLITQILPWKKLTVDTLKSFQVPLWNPYSFSGTVHAANYQSAVFSPTLLLFLIFPFVHAWSLHVLIQPLLCGIFTYVFLQSLRRSEIASLIGSISFMFCGFMTTWMGYETLGWAILYLPFSLFSITKYLETNNWWYRLLLTLSISLSLLSGHYQISLYALGMIVFYIIGTKSTLLQKKQLGISIFMGIGLCMFQILLSAHALLQSNRASSFTSGSIPWKYFITLFSPDFYGNPVTRNDWFGQYAEWAGYIGVIPLGLAIYAISSRRWKDLRLFVIAGCLSLLFVATTPLNSLLYALHIPIISTSVATRMIVIVSFCLSVLSAYGLDFVVSDWKENKQRNILHVCVVIFLFLISLVALVGIFHIVPAQYLSTAKRNSVLPVAFAIGFLGILFTGLKFKKSRPILLLLFVVLTSLEMLRYAQKWMPFDPQKFVYPELPVISFLQEHVKENRIYGTFGNELDTYYHLPSIEGYDALYQQRYGEFISAAADGRIQELQRSVVQIDKGGLYTEKWLELMGVKYLLYRKSDGRNVWVFPHWKYPQYISVYQDEQYEVLENTAAFPRSFLTSSYTLVSDKNEILQKLVSGGMDLHTNLLLEEALPVQLTAGTGKTEITSYTPNSVDIRVTTNGQQLLFLSDVFDDGWHAIINGKEEKIYRADYAFRAVPVPSGTSTVHFYYWPKEFTLGLIISILCVIYLGIESVKKLRYEHRHI